MRRWARARKRAERLQAGRQPIMAIAGVDCKKSELVDARPLPSGWKAWPTAATSGRIDRDRPILRAYRCKGRRAIAALDPSRLAVYQNAPKAVSCSPRRHWPRAVRRRRIIADMSSADSL